MHGSSASTTASPPATHLALLRGVNLGSSRRLAMSDLRAVIAGLGFARVQTVLQSGNFVFAGGRKAPASLERLLEVELGEQLQMPMEVFVRTASEWAGVIERNPFPAESRRDPSHVLVMALKDAPTARAIQQLTEAHRGPEPFRVDGRVAYAYYPSGLARSKLALMMDAKLGTRGTARNWNTVLKLAALVGL